MEYEDEWWRVIWLRPKIAGSFDIATELKRGINASNATIEPFAENITQALADTIPGVAARDFLAMNIAHMWEDQDFILKGWETGFPTLWKIHIFRIDYELVIWDKNIIEEIRWAMFDILEPESETMKSFRANLWRVADMVLREIFSNAVPIMFNETVILGGPPSASMPTYPMPSLMFRFLASTMVLLALSPF